MLLCTFLFVGIGIAVAQTKKASGTITAEEDGLPVVGASVLVKGTEKGTITDFDGKFKLTNLPNDATTLVISYIGMVTQEVELKENLTIVLKSDAKQLDEIVVTAMGISKEKKALSYAVQDIKAEKLTQAASSNLTSALQGKLAGVDITPSSGMPGASSNMVIRGARSFTGDNSPLYVIDGMPIASTSDLNTDVMNNGSVVGSDYANRAVDLDPNDIESINILKGQAASALYGMRASNGVVVITTKSGKNAEKGKPQVSFNTNLSFDKVSTLPDLQTEYAQGNKGVFDPYSGFSWGPVLSELPNDPTYGGNVSNAYTADGLHKGQYYVPQRAAAGLDPWATPRAYNNAKDFYNTGVTWNNSVNVAQAFDKGNYSFSLGNSKQNGIVPSTGMDRYNVKLTGEANLSKNFTTGFSGNFIASKITKQGTGNDGVTATVYTAPISYDMAGIPAHVQGEPHTQNTFRESWIDNAYWACDNNEFIERSQRFFGNAYLKYTTDFGTDNRHKLDIKYQLGDDAYTTNYSDTYGYGTTSYYNGFSRQYSFTVNEMNSLLTFTYNWRINDELAFDALLGNELVNKQINENKTEGYAFNFPGWNHMNNASSYLPEYKYRRKRTIGNFGSLSLAWKSMLYLNVTGRNDIVSSMPRNNRSFFYPSVSLGWIFTELEPLKNDVLTYGKLRASYAEVGMAGDYLPSYYYTPSYGGGFFQGNPITYPMNGVMSYNPYYVVYDPNLKPQNTKSYEIGADLTFWDGLVTINYTYARQNVKDQIFEVPLSGSTGAQSMMMNGGKIHTDSHELTLGISPVNQKNFKLDFAFNFSKLNNYVDELAPGVESIMLGGFVTPQVRAGIGDKFPVIYGISYLRNEEGKIIVDKNGMPQAGAPDVIGHVSPDFRLGFNTNIELYKFRLSAVFDWKQGGQMYHGTAGELNYYGVSQLSADYRKKDFIVQNAVKEVGTDSNGNPVYAPNDIVISKEDAEKYFSVCRTIDESYIYDNSFLKLREISLAYPVYKAKNLSVDVNVFARNIILWSELKGFDPEATQGNNNMAGAFERFSLPGTSSYGFGLNLKF